MRCSTVKDKPVNGAYSLHIWAIDVHVVVHIRAGKGTRHRSVGIVGQDDRPRADNTVGNQITPMEVDDHTAEVYDVA
jgi:hypothetical protein